MDLKAWKKRYKGTEYKCTYKAQSIHFRTPMEHKILINTKHRQKAEKVIGLIDLHFLLQISGYLHLGYIFLFIRWL